MDTSFTHNSFNCCYVNGLKLILFESDQFFTIFPSFDPILRNFIGMFCIFTMQDRNPACYSSFPRALSKTWKLLRSYSLIFWWILLVLRMISSDILIPSSVLFMNCTSQVCRVSLRLLYSKSHKSFAILSMHYSVF